MTDYSRSFCFAFAKQQRDKLESELKAAGDAWNAIPGVGAGVMGLTPDAIKFSPEYRRARAAYDAAHKRLRLFNRRFCAHYAGELKAERAARRAAGKL